MLCFKCHYVAASHHLLVKILGVISKTPLFCDILVKIEEFDPWVVNVQGHLLLFGN